MNTKNHPGQGKIVIITGEHGSGKSTLCRCTFPEGTQRRF